MLLNYGRSIPPEIILENLYPDETYKNPKNTIQNIVYRLRKLLKDDDFFKNYDCNIVFSNGCYSLLLNKDVFVDSSIFEQCIQKAEVSSRENSDEAIELYEKALALYKGDYFPELVYEDWVTPKRNYLRRQYIQSALHLIRLLQKNKEYEKCIKICDKVLLVEPYEEDVHISFIENLIENGNIKDAQNHYGYYTSMLYKQFGIKPTTELQQVYKLLKNSGAKLNGLSMDNNLEDQNSIGAFYCDTKLFNSIFVLEKRRSERSGHIVFIVSLTAGSYCDICDFRKTLIKSLRRGDVVTDWNEDTLLILLPKMDYKQIITIIDRIIFQYKKEINNNNFEVKVKTCSDLPTTK